MFTMHYKKFKGWFTKLNFKEVYIVMTCNKIEPLTIILHSQTIKFLSGCGFCIVRKSVNQHTLHQLDTLTKYKFANYFYSQSYNKIVS